MELSDGINDRHRALRSEAEIKVKSILLDLEAATGLRVGHVEVDTHNFTNCEVEIWFKEPQSR